MLPRWCHERRPTAHGRSLWTTLASRVLSTAAGDGAAIPNGVGVAESASAKKRRQQATEFELLPAALDDFAKGTGHYVVPLHLPIPLLNQAGQAPPKALNKRVRKVHVYGLVEDVNAIAWRDEVRGIKLGRVLKMFLDSNHRQRKQPHVVAQLLERGFARGRNSRDLETYTEYKWRCQTKPALRVFHEIHGHSMVKHQYQVPRDDNRWPDTTKGFPLGEAVNTIRQHQDKLTPQQLTDLLAVDFSPNVYETTWSEKVLPSLEVFARIYGHCNVPLDFVVPSSEPWPGKAWGLTLGMTVNMIRSHGIVAAQVARDQHRLEAIKFVWDHDEHQWSNRILPSLETYYGQYGDCLVPVAFVVPSETPWPEEVWGLKLGKTVQSMRTIETFTEQVERDSGRLEAIGFSWNVSQDRWDKAILPALEMFFQIHGDNKVPQKFVVPCEAPWPKQMWGFKLGTTCNNIRNLGHYAEQCERDEARLKAINFRVKTVEVGPGY